METIFLGFSREGRPAPGLAPPLVFVLLILIVVPCNFILFLNKHKHLIK